MKNLFKLSFLLFAIVFASCSDDDTTAADPTDDTNPTSISNFVATTADYSTLANALEITSLTETLNGEGPFTVFAPNNDAFAAFLAANGFTSLEDVPVDVLTNTLLNHVVLGTNNAADLTTSYINSLAVFGETSRNLSLYIDITTGVTINGVSTVTQADIAVTNGVIHAVDSVIALPTIVTQALANPAFSTLVEALVAASDDATDYVALLSGTTASPFTVFAPTNDAFSASLINVPQDLLQAILNYHVVAQANVQSADLSDGQSIVTFQGESLTVSLTNGAQIIDATQIPANIVVVDVQTSNGVIHALDKVLLPQAVIDVVDPTLTTLAMMTPSLSTLSQALEITGLDVVLNDRDASFTVFAPTNASFEAFLDGAALSDIPVDDLTQLLLNHTLTGVALSTDLTTGYTNTLATFNNEPDALLSLFVNTSAGVLLNAQSSVSSADNLAANGVVHIVDAVIALPSVITFAQADPDFETLLSALDRDDQPDYLAVLGLPNGVEPAPFTIFAPDNDAFADFLTEFGLSSLDQVDGLTLSQTLNTHAVPTLNIRAEALVDGTLITFGDPIIIDAANATVTDQNGRVCQITQTNLQAANGVVHKIDKVLFIQ